MTTTRWWAPASPHIGPDDTDLVMLRTGGGSPRLDLGASLIAAHRVGAAALMDAARTPLVDSRTVIAKLADARLRLGILLSESVSKSVGDRRYAMVLVRDLLDDADMAAHDLFRAAIAKHVAPSIAAQRAAAVYGVDARGMSQYRQLALDPRAHHQAVNDAADRALFEYIEKVAETEADDREEVSKAPAAEQERPAVAVTPDDPETSYYDGRDTSGRFAPQVGGPSVLARLRSRYGIGAQEPPKVDDGRPSERAAEVEEQLPTKGKSLAELRREREKRRTGARRNPRPRVRQQAVQQEERGQLQRSQHQRKQHERSQLKLTQQQKKQLTKIAPKSTAKPTIEVEQAQRNHPFLDRVDANPETYRIIPQEMLVHATEAQAMDFFSRLAASPGYVARIGHLFERTGANTVEESGTRAAGEQLRGFARMADGQDPGTSYISAEELAGFETLRQQEDYLEGKRQEMAWRNGRLDRGRLEHISVLPSNDDEGMVVVDESDTIAKGTPTVFEFVVVDSMGRVDGGEGSKHMQWSLDPNQAYKFSRPENWETTFDYEHGVLVKRVYAQHVDEHGVHEYKTGIRKAEATAHREGLATAPDGTRYYDVRDDKGQFTSGGPSLAQRLKERSIVPQAAQQPVGRPAKQPSLAERRATRERRRQGGARQRRKPERITREIAPVRGQLQRGQAQRKQLQTRQHQRHQHLARTISEVVATRHRNTVLNDHSDYAVLSPDDARRSFGINPANPHHQVMPVRPDDAEYLAEIRTDGEYVNSHIAYMATDPFDLREVALIDYPHDDESQAGLTAIVDDYMERDGVGLVEARPVSDDLVSIRVNRAPIQPVAIVEFSGDFNEGIYDSEGMNLQFASRTTVQHDELLKDGTVRSYVVPVVRFIATPGRNARGRR